ncbi:MAG: hypothetical protein COA70_05100 [Planctomycetota bacterium]|nr:MAG: hypothetical protein COA70_05100 [Planctomycetota bacterium]
MSDNLQLPPLGRGKLALCLGMGGAGLGCFVGALEGRWIAYRDLIPTTPFALELLAICMTYAILLGGLGCLLGFLRRWKKPRRVLSGLLLTSAAWLLPYQTHSAWVTPLGLSVIFLFYFWWKPSTLKLRFLSSTCIAGFTLVLLSGYPKHPNAPRITGAKDLPNIVLVVIDTLRADFLSSYGHLADGKATTPVLDRLATKGVRFEAAYAQAPWTRPSTASLFTGLYPASHGIVTPFDPLAKALPTMASMLQNRGYQTAAFSANPQISTAFGFNHGFDRFWSSTARLKDRSAGIRLARKLGLGSVEVQPERGVLHSTADDVNQAVGQWLDHKASGEATFLYVHYLDPHDPYSAPEDLLGVKPGLPVDESILYASQDLPPFPLEAALLPGLDSKELRELKRRYETEIRFVDDRLGKMLERLREEGIWGENDYLVITSDHGEEFHEHQQWQHGRSLYEEMIHVPLIVLGPNIPPGTVVSESVELVDVLPTMANWSGAPPDFDQHGEGLFGERLKFGAFSHRPREKYPIWSLRIENQKTVWIQNQKELLRLDFDLQQDPKETNPLNPGGPTVFPQLHRRLEELMTSSAEYKHGPVDALELDSRAAQDLEQLGYIDGAEED